LLLPKETAIVVAEVSNFRNSTFGTTTPATQCPGSGASARAKVPSVTSVVKLEEYFGMRRGRVPAAPESEASCEASNN